MNCMGWESGDGEQTWRIEKARVGNDSRFTGSLRPPTGAKWHVSLERWLIPMTVLLAVSAEFVRTLAFPTLLF